MMDHFKSARFLAAHATLTTETTAYHAVHGNDLETLDGDQLILDLTRTLGHKVTGPNLQELLDLIAKRAVCEDNEAELGYSTKDPEYAVVKGDRLDHLDEMIRVAVNDVMGSAFIDNFGPVSV